MPGLTRAVPVTLFQAWPTSPPLFLCVTRSLSPLTIQSMSPSLPVTLSFSPCQCHPLSVIRYLSPSACHIFVTMISQLPVTLAYLSHPLRSEVSMSPFVCHAVHVTLYRCHPVSIFLSPRLSHPLLGTLWSRCNPISFILYSLPVMLSLSPYLAISVTLFLSGAGEEGGEVTTDT